MISRYRFSEAGKFPDYFNDPVAQLERMNIATSDSIDGDTDIQRQFDYATASDPSFQFVKEMMGGEGLRKTHICDAQLKEHYQEHVQAKHLV